MHNKQNHSLLITEFWASWSDLLCPHVWVVELPDIFLDITVRYLAHILMYLATSWMVI